MKKAIFLIALLLLGFINISFCDNSGDEDDNSGDDGGNDPTTTGPSGNSTSESSSSAKSSSTSEPSSSAKSSSTSEPSSSAKSSSSTKSSSSVKPSPTTSSSGKSEAQSEFEDKRGTKGKKDNSTKVDSKGKLINNPKGKETIPAANVIHFLSIETFAKKGRTITFNIIGKVTKGNFKNTKFIIVLVIYSSRLRMRSRMRSRLRNLDENSEALAECGQSGDKDVGTEGKTLEESYAVYNCNSEAKVDLDGKMITPKQSDDGGWDIKWTEPPNIDAGQAEEPSLLADKTMTDDTGNSFSQMIASGDFDELYTMKTDDVTCSFGNKIQLDLKGQSYALNENLPFLKEKMKGTLNTDGDGEFNCDVVPNYINDPEDYYINIKCTSNGKKDVEKIKITSKSIQEDKKALMFNLPNSEIICVEAGKEPEVYYGAGSSSSLSTGGIVAIVVVCVVIVVAIAAISFLLKKKDIPGQEDFGSSVDTQARIKNVQ